MKIFKKIVLSIALLIALSLLGGYFYFDKKFTPPENNLKVSGITEHISLKWEATEGNSHAAVLIPVSLKGIEQIFYMQLDSDSPTTLFYKKSLESIITKFPDQVKINNAENQVSMQFSIGNMNIASDFELLDYGHAVDFNDATTNHIIGTIGTDLFEKRIVILDFRKTICSFIENLDENGFESLKFKKRKILIPGTIGDQKLKLLYDSGTSGYELLTNKEEWGNTELRTEKLKKKKEIPGEIY